MTAIYLETLFSKYLTVRSFEVNGERWDVLSGPGHDVVVVTCFLLGSDGGLRFVLKEGDTRPSRALRGTPYVKDGLVAGRLDHASLSPEATAIAEVEEEVGAEVIGAPIRLGAHPVPTMPGTSTEADHYLLAAVEFPKGRKPTGDGGGMEVAELMGPIVLTGEEVLDRARSGAVGEACRARVAFGRALEKLGERSAVPILHNELAANETLGLGPVLRPERWPLEGREISLAQRTPPEIDGAHVDILEEVRLSDPSARLVAARAVHTASSKPLGDAFPVQILDLSYNEVEILPVAFDEDGVPWVSMQKRPSQVLNAKATLQEEVQGHLLTPTALWQGWVGRAEVGAEKAAAAELAVRLGLGDPELLIRSEASPGQSTLCEFAFAAPSSTFDGLLRIDRAIERVRIEGGSARTEAALLELATFEL